MGHEGKFLKKMVSCLSRQGAVKAITGDITLPTLKCEILESRAPKPLGRMVCSKGSWQIRRGKAMSKLPHRQRKTLLGSWCSAMFSVSEFPEWVGVHESTPDDEDNISRSVKGKPKNALDKKNSPLNMLITERITHRILHG